jgi:predicted RNA-binding Zn-ribbon protein involved in translation (DUF1610 family)
MVEQDNTLIRSSPCPSCGEMMLWTQAAWPPDQADERDAGRAAYRCLQGHLVDPAETPQCPGCGIHDTAREGDGTDFRCTRCGTRFAWPR